MSLIENCSLKKGYKQSVKKYVNGDARFGEKKLRVV
jgi:hypothetical protein